MHKKELWLRIKNYHFEHLVVPSFWEQVTARFGGIDASTKAFADKIARKHNWGKGFAILAVEEYKKFIYLGIVSSFYVTPSKIIDVVWHEHLLFSKAYRIFCKQVIEHDFDHYPELVPAAEQTAQFYAQYLATIELYTNEFGVTPPAYIWELAKFDKEKVTNTTTQKKKADNEDNSSWDMYDDDTPLYTYFNNSDTNEEGEKYPEFETGGSFGGAGASGDWDDKETTNNEQGMDVENNQLDSTDNSNSDSSDTSSSDSGGCSGGCGGGGGD
jgi:hypothetical protein